VKQNPLVSLSEWESLKQEANKISGPEYHLKYLLQDPERFDKYSLNASGLLFDFSRQRIDGTVMSLLNSLAEKRHVLQNFQEMIGGHIVNLTEKRAALHTATRSFNDSPISCQGTDVMPDMHRIRHEVKTFADAVHEGRLKMSS